MPAAAHLPARPVRALLIGATGRMGRALLAAAPAFSQELTITAAVASPGSRSLGRDAGEVAGLAALELPVTSDLRRALDRADVALDFSTAAATRANLAACRAAHKPLLLGTSGIGAELGAEFDAAAREIPLLVAANTSLGVTLLIELVRTAARALPPGFDIDILEAHHRTKADAPSGTALALELAAREARGVQGAESAADKSARTAPIGLASVRAGDLVGEHTVAFTGAGEQLTLAHRATDRAIFARGALAAALWLVAQPPGRYAMRDFIGL